VGEDVQIEGNVASGNASAFQLDRMGNHPGVVNVDASSATYRCVGQAKGNCQANLKPGAQVHVRGTVASCSGNSLVITASEVKVQKP